MKHQHSSIFSYNLSKPYPFRWFTPVTVIAGIFLTALFSWLNYATNGFEMVVITTSDLNGTTSDAGDLGGLPAILTGKFRPNCQPTSLNVNDRFFTNNSALRYEILEIGRNPSQRNDLVSPLPALAYSNNVLEACTIQKVDLEISSNSRTTQQLIVSQFSPTVRTYVACNVTTPSGPITLRLLNVYDLGYHDGSPPFVSHNASSQSSLWWGESVLSVYWHWLAADMEFDFVCPEDVCEGIVRRAIITFKPSRDSVQEVLDPSFLEMSWFMTVERPDASVHIYYFNSGDRLRHASDYIEGNHFPTTWWSPSEKLAKSAWSTVLADLGQDDRQSNVLLDEERLRNFTSDFEFAYGHTTNIGRGPEVDQYDPSNSTFSLGTSPSIISAVYICNIPRRKSTGTLAWSIILANLVFLQAMWKLFKLAVDTYLEKKMPEAGFCAGCRQGDSLLDTRDDYRYEGGQGWFALSPTKSRHAYHRQSSAQS